MPGASNAAVEQSGGHRAELAGQREARARLLALRDRGVHLEPRPAVALTMALVSSP